MDIQMCTRQKLADEAEPAYVLRGDGVAIGWYVITSFQQDDQYLSARGVGRVIGVQMDLTMCEAPDQKSGAKQLRGFAQRMGWS